MNKLIKGISGYITILIIILNASLSYSDWVGPTTIIRGTWGRGLSQFGLKTGRMKDKFPEKIHVLPDNSIIIEDWLNYRFKIFTMNGEYLKSIGTLYNLVVMDSDRLAGFYWDAAASKPRAGVYSIGQKKWLWFDKKTAYNFDAIKLDVVNDQIYAWNGMESKGYNYTAKGELLKNYSSHPKELGFKSTKRSGPFLKTTISYPNETYTIFAKDPVGIDYRDKNNFLYYVKTTVTPSGDRVREVYRYDICGKEKGMIKLPLSVYEPKPTPQGKLIPIEEYGGPVVSQSGDVYASVRSKTEFKVVKWTWVDKRGDPAGGPDEPEEVRALPTASGAYLTWKAAPQDPGCVKGYEIQRAASPYDDYSKGVIVPRHSNETYGYNDGNAKSGERWYYRIRSVSDMGKSKYVDVNAAMP